MIFGIINLFSRIFNAVPSEESCPTSVPFLSTYIRLQDSSFSRLLNLDWSIQISGAPVVFKGLLTWISFSGPLILGHTVTLSCLFTLIGFPNRLLETRWRLFTDSVHISESCVNTFLLLHWGPVQLFASNRVRFSLKREWHGCYSKLSSIDFARWFFVKPPTARILAFSLPSHVSGYRLPLSSVRRK